MSSLAKWAWLLLVGAVCSIPLSSCLAAAPPCSASVQTCTFGGGYRLKAGQSVQVGAMTLAMQADGNLVIYQSGAALWASSYLPAQDALPFSGPTYGMSCALCFAAFQTDGNLVLYQPAPSGTGSVPYWASNTPQNSAATFRLSATIPLSIVSATGSVLWVADVFRPRFASYAVAMDQLWNRAASFQPLVNMQIPTKPASGLPFVDGMDEGTRIIVANGAWYLFSREYNYAPNPPQCRYDFSRIVVRSSTDHGKSWSGEVVIAEPNLALGECALADGHGYWDAGTGTWHYLVQMLRSDSTWNIDHFSLQSPNPTASFIADSANPVVKSGALWGAICGPGKSCPSGTVDEGTPEISLKSNGLYYVTFHGVNIGSGSQQIITGYRGIAVTPDFHTWITSGNGLPNDAIWSSKDCQSWSVSWSSTTGCVGGGDASTLMTAQYTYMLIESSDVSVGCFAGQNWVIGLVRAPAFAASGHWEQLPSNPLLNEANGAPCAIQYPSLFEDSGQVYASYWTLGSTGANDPNTYFHIARLQP